jgi:hypothetical protein
VRADVAVPGGPGAVRQAAHAILARPEFQPTPQSPLQRLRAWVLHQLARIFSVVLGGGSHGILGAILAIAVVAGVVALLVRAIRSVQDPPSRRRFVVAGPVRRPEDWRAEADACARRGDWRGVLRCRYRAVVADLAARGVVEEIDGTTTGEYRRTVEGSLPAAVGPFGAITEAFERTWYGDEPASAQDAARVEELTDAVMAGLR